MAAIRTHKGGDSLRCGMELLWRLGYLLALLAVGVGARAVGLLTERRTDWLTAAAFYVALPALIFSSTYDQNLGELVSAGLVAGVVGVFAVTVAVAWLVHRREPAQGRRSVAVVQSYHTNFGFLGVPLVALTFGDAATAIASVILGIGALTQVPLTVVSLVAVNDADAAIAGELRELASNPVLIALVAGLAASTVEFTLPTAASTGLGLASELALPLALLGVGASLRLNLGELDTAATGWVVAMKVAVMPAVAWALFSLLSVTGTAFAAGVLMFGMPTAVSTYVYANELGGDARFASVNVFATTLASLATIAVIVTLVG